MENRRSGVSQRVPEAEPPEAGTLLLNEHAIFNDPY